MYGRTVESVELGDSWCWCIELSWPELSIVLSNWSTVVVWKLVPYSMSPFSGHLCDCKLQETKETVPSMIPSDWLWLLCWDLCWEKKQRWPWFEPLQGSGLFPGGTIGAMVGLNTSEFPYTEISWLVKWVYHPYMVWMDVMLLLWWTIGCSMTCWHDCSNLNKLWATSIDQVNESWWNQLNVWTRMLSDCGDWFNPDMVEGIWATRFPPDCQKSYDSCWTVRVLLAHLGKIQ